MLFIKNKKQSAFTLIEMLVIIPVVMVVVGVIITAIVSMTGDVLVSRASSSLSYDIQDALDTIQQDVNESGGFLSVNNITLTSPQGYNNDTTNFQNASSANGTMLILNSYATTKNPLDIDSSSVFAAGQPNSCSSASVNKNLKVMVNIVYFVKNNSLWRRVIMPTGYDTLGCSMPWQKPTCSVGYSSTFCKANDQELVTGITSFSINYYSSSNPTTSNTIAGNSSQTDSVRQVALKTTPTAEVTISASSTVAGRTVTKNGSIRADSPNNNFAYTVSVAPAVTTQPTDRTVSAGTTNVTFSANASGSNVTVQWQRSIDIGSTWSNISGAVSPTLTITSTDATMDGYQYRAIFTNSYGSVTTAVAKLYIYVGWTSLSYASGWSDYNNDMWSSGAYRMTTSGMVVLKGLVKKASAPSICETIASIPVAYAPSKRIIFPSISGNAGTDKWARIDILPSGAVQYCGGGPDWISLENIHYIPGNSRYNRTVFSSFSNGWSQFNDASGEYAQGSYITDNLGRIQIQGLLRAGTTTDNTLITPLAAAQRPSSYMHVTGSGDIFSYYGLAAADNGIMAKNTQSTWMSITNFYYPAAATVTWNDVSFQNSWTNFGDIFTSAQYTKSSDGMVTLRGLTKGGASGAAIFTLPDGYRPTSISTFVNASCGAMGRLNITPDGRVVIVIGNSGWLSLDGISFFADQ